MWILIGVVGLLGLYALAVEPFWVSLHDLHVDIVDLPAEFEGFTILHLSDLHGRVGAFLRPAVRHALTTCDVVALTGDLYSPTLPRDRLVQHLTTLDSDKLFYVSGNHDYRHGKLFIEPWNPGPALLDNRVVRLTKGEQYIWLAGLPDLVKGRPQLGQVVQGITTQAPAVLLSHRPDVWSMHGVNRFQLILSGHTHGGQVRFPWVGAVLRHNRLPKRYVSGVMVHKGRPTLITSQGLGTSELPIRFMARPEVLRIVLHKSTGRDVPEV